jgi:acyl-lipid omega-6 desaturase (Delta-12 desaturase)
VYKFLHRELCSC